MHNFVNRPGCKSVKSNGVSERQVISFPAAAWRSCPDFLLQICDLFLTHFVHLALDYKALMFV